jgi:hypothetical protein
VRIVWFLEEGRPNNLTTRELKNQDCWRSLGFLRTTDRISLLDTLFPTFEPLSCGVAGLAGIQVWSSYRLCKWAMG